MNDVYYNEHDPKSPAWLRELMKAEFIEAWQEARGLT